MGTMTESASLAGSTAAPGTLSPSSFAGGIGPGLMDAPIARGKPEKLLGQDLAPQAMIGNVHENGRLIVGAASGCGIAAPIMDVCHRLCRKTPALGLRDADMISVIRAIGQQTAAIA